MRPLAAGWVPGILLSVFLGLLGPACSRQPMPLGRDAWMGDADLPPPVAGSRLRPVLAEGDGATVFTGWIDTALQVRCYFTVQGAVVYCSPSSPGNVRTGDFADAECSRPLAALKRSSCPPAFISAPQRAGCDYFLFRAGPKAPTGAQRYARGTLDGVPGCIPVGALPDGYDGYETGDPVPQEMLVAGKVRELPGSGRLGVLLVEMDDGARDVLSLVDRQLGSPCNMLRAADGSIRCLPQTSGHTNEVSIFSDATCTTRVLTSVRACPSDSFVRRAVADACPPRTSVDAVGAPAMSTYQLRGATCVRQELSGEINAFARGPEVPPTDLAEGTYGPDPGRGRLRSYQYTWAGGRQKVRTLRDQALEIDCVAELASDGVLRCLPTRLAFVDDAFADPACTIPLAERPSGACPVTYGARIDSSICPARGLLFRLAGPHTGMVYSHGASGCAPAADPPPGRYLTLGEAVAPTEFAALKESP